jgi:hypothetical protein
MSYDLALFLLPPGEAAADVYEALAEAGLGAPAVAEKELRKQRIADVLTRRDPGLRPFAFDFAEIARSLEIGEAEAREQYRDVELNGPEDQGGPQIILADDVATLSIPYWHRGEKAKAVLRELAACAGVIQDETGWAVYDPQLDRVVDLAADLGEMQAVYDSVMTQIPRKDAGSAAAAEPGRPWWKLW